MRTILLSLLAVLCVAAPVTARDLNFCWVGNGGYTVTGQMGIPDSQMRSMVTENDVTKFTITGYQNGRRIGGWSMSDTKPGTTWHLRFDPLSMSFLLGGSFPTVASQGWNADGDVTNCGATGFGFNAGNYAQDICLNGKWIEASSIHPSTPLLAGPDPVAPDCRVQDLSS